MRSLSIEQRAVVMRRGLEERSANVKAAAVAMLKSWLEQAGGEPEELLRAMDVETHEAVSELMLQALLDAGVLSAVELAEAAAKDGAGLRAPASGPPLSLSFRQTPAPVFQSLKAGMRIPEFRFFRV